VAGLLLTGLATWATARVDRSTEQRLLTTQSRQAASALGVAILLVERPLASALDQQAASGTDATAFRRSMQPYLGVSNYFVNGSLWRWRGGRPVRVTAVGTAPLLRPGDPVLRALLQRARRTDGYAVHGLLGGASPRIAYAEARGNLVVYAERAIPPGRRSTADRDAAFADLHYAIYLGRKVRPDALATTDRPLSSLPLTGTTTTTTLPYGDTVLTMVTTPRSHLGGNLGRRLPFALLVGGLVLTLLTAGLIRQVVRGRQAVEADARTIASLYRRLDSLYGKEREISERLQRALLPMSNPVMDGLEVASEYLAGAQGVEIGGDWYSIIALDDSRFGFVVGDVSGRGVDAVAVMAHARFTLRAYLLDGDGPGVALAKTSKQLDIAVDGHMTTVLVGTGDVRTGEFVLATAGHPPPLLLAADGGRFLDLEVGRPLGLGQTAYATTTVHVPDGATLLAYTDGLVERRGEDIDVSLARLRTTAEGLATTPLDGFVGDLLAAMRRRGAEDDVAVLALRRTGL
jgi:serine phosphatase RsbU (regulator of sigma subunit)